MNTTMNNIEEELYKYIKKKNSTVKEFFENIIQNPKVPFDIKEKLIRNIAVIAHVDHGKSTLTDSLLAETGLIQKKLAGEILAMDHDEIESERGITINSTGVSMVYNNHLINLVDTPGHADFAAEVTKALRAIDGAIILMDINEGIKVQTESVITQAISEGVVPILFLNKIDTCINRSIRSEKELLELINTRTAQVNDLVREIYRIKEIPEENRTFFDLNKNVLVGSGLEKWAFKWYEMENTYTTEKFIKAVSQRSKSLCEDFNLAKAVLDCIIANTPSPLEKQKRRIETLFNEEEPQAFENLSSHVKAPKEESPFCGIVTNITYDKNLGWLHNVRILSGALKKNERLYSSYDSFISPIKKPLRTSIAMIDKRIDLEHPPTGSIVLFQGCNIEQLPIPGTTIYSESMDPKVAFPPINYTRSAMYCLSVTPKKTVDTSKMIDYLKILAIEDPTILFEEDLQTKEYKLSGVGVLHLEVTLDKLKRRFGIETNTGNPIVPYIETLPDNMEKSNSKLKRSPNKLNDIEFHIINLEEDLVKRLVNKEISNKMIAAELKKYGYPKDFCQSYLGNLNNGCLLFNMTHGALYIDITKGTLIESAQQALREGYWLKSPMKGIGLVMTFAKLHETKLHRSEKEYRELFKSGIKEILAENSIIKEPYLNLYLRMPMDYCGRVQSLMKLKKGVLLDTLEDYHPEYLTFVYEIPLAQTFDLQKDLMSCTEGKAMFHTKFSRFVKVSEETMNQLNFKKKK